MLDQTYNIWHHSIWHTLNPLDHLTIHQKDVSIVSLVQGLIVHWVQATPSVVMRHGCRNICTTSWVLPRHPKTCHQCGVRRLTHGYQYLLISEANNVVSEEWPLATNQYLLISEANNVVSEEWPLATNQYLLISEANNVVSEEWPLATNQYLQISEANNGYQSILANIRSQQYGVRRVTHGIRRVTHGYQYWLISEATNIL